MPVGDRQGWAPEACLHRFLLGLPKRVLVALPSIFGFCCRSSTDAIFINITTLDIRSNVVSGPHPITQGKNTKFFVVSDDITKNATGMIIANEADLKPSGTIPFMPLDKWQRGFGHLSDVRVKLRYDRRKGRFPKDLEVVRGCWLITDRLKVVLEDLASSSIVFRECDLEVGEETADHRFWLCDVTRIVDAIDEERSTLTKHTYPDRDRVLFTLPSLGKMVIREKIASESEVFRLHQSEHTVVCSARTQNIIKNSKFQGIHFIPAGYS